MKKIAASFISFFLSALLFAGGFETDISLYNELKSSYNSGFYPGVVEYSNRLLKSFPESAYAGSALVLKGESLVRLNQMDEAFLALKKAEKLDNDKEVKVDSKYWLARVFDAKKDYQNALSYYFEYCASTSSGENSKYFANAIFRSASIFYVTEDFKKAVQNYEYVVKNGGKYSKNDFSTGLLKLADSYNKSGSAEKTISLYSKFTKDMLENKVYFAFTEFAGDAYALQKKYRRAYELYCEVLASGEKSLAANALKKAYNVSAEHKNDVGAEPGKVLQDAQQALSDSPELLGEFWTRLGIDAFISGDLKKSLDYFSEADKYPSEELSELSAIYRAEITAGKKITAKTAAAAESFIKEAQKKQLEMQSPRYVNDYNRLLIKYAAYQKNWEDVKSLSEKIQNPDDSTKYYIALAQYETGDYVSSAKLLFGKDDELYALTLARQQKLKEAANIYDTSDKKIAITPEERLNYAKVLILSGRYREAQIEANKSGLNEGKYILGLAQFNTRSWKYAEESFSQFLKNADSKDSSQLKAISYANFYNGYAQYRQGKAKEAYENLSGFAAKYPNHELLWNSQMTAANAAIQLGNYQDGIVMAEAAIKSSRNNDDREEAVLLCAEIHSDSGHYEKAISLLSPYSRLKNQFGMKSLYAMAQIYEKMKDYRLADSTYAEVGAKFPSEKTGEEAMYRRGELYYGIAGYSSALKCFNEYAAKYPNGNFIAASWFFAADCMARLNNSERAILQYQALVKKFPESAYVYGSSKNLIDLYRIAGKYGNALENARFLLEKYGDQARNDGIAEIAADLEKLASGKNEAMVSKENEFRRAGGTNTPAGRKAGTELVTMYAKSTATSADGIKLAEQILPLQKKNLPAESLWAAQNADILAQVYRIQGKNKKSAEMFLSAAEYYRMNANGDQAAAALYGAYDAFNAADLSGDANETARTLKALYPESRQASAVKIEE